MNVPEGSVDYHCLAVNRWRRPAPLAPESVAHNGNGLSPGRSIFSPEVAANCGSNAENGPQIPGHEIDGHFFRGQAAGEDLGRPSVVGQSHKRSIELRIVHEIGGRNRQT